MRARTPVRSRRGLKRRECVSGIRNRRCGGPARACAVWRRRRITNDPTLSGRLVKRLLTTLELRWFRLDSHRSSGNMRAIVGSLVGLVGFSSVALALSPGVPPSTFPTEPEARRHCPTDIVVWLNSATGAFYYRDQRWYGNTKGGAFACRNEVSQSTDRASKNGQ